jgi:hypothetical protein
MRWHIIHAYCTVPTSAALRMAIPNQRSHNRNMSLIWCSPSPEIYTVAYCSRLTAPWRDPIWSNLVPSKKFCPLLSPGVTCSKRTTAIPWYRAWCPTAPAFCTVLTIATFRTYIPNQRSHNRNMSLLWCGFRHLQNLKTKLPSCPQVLRV